MEYNKALSQISEIHAQLAKGEIYRGFRSLPVALSGLAGFAAAALAPRLLAPTTSAARCAIGSGRNCLWLDWLLRDRLELPDARGCFRSATIAKVWGQFLPGLAAGIGLTWCIDAGQRAR